jgi:hypothetical protein
MSYKLFRGTTLVGTSKTAHASVIGAAQNLLPPSVKEANGPILNPVQAKDALHIVVPANAALLPDDKLKVTWTGAPGTPAGGSHSSGEWPVRDGWEVPIPNSVVAFNLGKAVTVTYTVIQNGVESPPSDPFTLNVQAMPVASLTMPLIPEAAQGGIGSVLDLSSFSGDARVTVAPWPLIAIGQRVWLKCEGTAAGNGADYTIPLYSSSAVIESELSAGLSKAIPRTELEKLRDGSELKVVLLVTFNRSSNESEAVAFPLRRYTKSDFSEHYTPFTDGNMNGWLPIGNASVKNEASNYYCELASRASRVAYIYRTDMPLISGKRFRISMRARSVSPDAQLLFRRGEGGLFVTWGGFTPEWKALSYEFSV